MRSIPGERGRIYRSLASSTFIGCGHIHKPDPTALQTEFCNRHEYSVFLLLEGGGTYRDESGIEIPLTAGDLVHRIPGLRHWTEPADDGRWREFFIRMPIQFHASLAASGIPSTQPIWHPGLDRHLVSDLLSFLPATRAADDAQLSRIIIDMLAWVGRAWLAHRSGTGAEDANLTQAKLLLAQEPALAVSPITVARRLGMDYRAFRRWFTRVAGEPPATYRLRARLDHACRLLASTTMPIPEVATACGFSDRYTLTRRFSAALGTTPAAFRRQQG